MRNQGERFVGHITDKEIISLLPRKFFQTNQAMNIQEDNGQSLNRQFTKEVTNYQ